MGLGETRIGLRAHDNKARLRALAADRGPDALPKKVQRLLVRQVLEVAYEQERLGLAAIGHEAIAPHVDAGAEALYERNLRIREGLEKPAVFSRTYLNG